MGRMNFRKGLLRRLILPVVCFGGFPNSEAVAATVTRSYAYDGTVNSACGPASQTVTMSVPVTGNNNTVGTITFSPAATVFCNATTGGTLSVSSTRLTNGNRSADYTLQVSGWGSPVSYTTNSPSPPPSTRSNAAQLSVTLQFVCSANCTSTNLSKNGTWTATITLGMTKN